MHELSIFCDESGDFGPYDVHAPYYILSFVMHDQSIDIMEDISNLEQAISASGFDKETPMHCGPIIRRENEFKLYDINVRRKLFDAIFRFYRHCNISFTSFVIEKKIYGGGASLSNRIDKLIGNFLEEHQGFFQGYDRVVVYYDKGQAEITRTLKETFSKYLNGVEFQVVDPGEYRLFQVADLLCTLELLRLKREGKTLTKWENMFFKNAKRLKNTYLRHIDEKRFGA